jgi:hypothetical protein
LPYASLLLSLESLFLIVSSFNSEKEKALAIQFSIFMSVGIPLYLYVITQFGQNLTQSPYVSILDTMDYRDL